MSNQYSHIFADKKLCPNPFVALEIHPTGDVAVCCVERLYEGYKFMGNIKENSLREIWNGERAQAFRRLMYEGNYDKSCKPFCPQLIAFKAGRVPPWYSHLCDAGVHEEVRQEKVRLDSPYRAFSVASDGSCNLYCIMCRKELKLRPSEDEKTVNKLLHEQILDDIETIKFLELTGNGDPFFNREISSFLERLKGRDLSGLTVRFITNGQLLTPKRWEEIETIGFKEIRVSVSIDAATAGTYESIRRGGKWRNLVKNMEYLGELRASGRIGYFQSSFVAMKRNIHEIVPFINLCRSWHCDRIEVQRIMGMIAGLENIFEVEDPHALAALAEVLEDPVFGEDFVDASPLMSYKGYRANGGKQIKYQRDKLAYGIVKVLKGVKDAVFKIL